MPVCKFSPIDWRRLDSAALLPILRYFGFHSRLINNLEDWGVGGPSLWRGTCWNASSLNAPLMRSLSRLDDRPPPCHQIIKCFSRPSRCKLKPILYTHFIQQPVSYALWPPSLFFPLKVFSGSQNRWWHFYNWWLCFDRPNYFTVFNNAPVWSVFQGNTQKYSIAVIMVMNDVVPVLGLI